MSPIIITPQKYHRAGPFLYLTPVGELRRSAFNPSQCFPTNNFSVIIVRCSHSAGFPTNCLVITMPQLGRPNLRRPVAMV